MPRKKETNNRHQIQYSFKADYQLSQDISWIVSTFGITRALALRELVKFGLQSFISFHTERIRKELDGDEMKEILERKVKQQVADREKKKFGKK